MEVVEVRLRALTDWHNTVVMEMEDIVTVVIVQLHENSMLKWDFSLKFGLCFTPVNDWFTSLFSALSAGLKILLVLTGQLDCTGGHWLQSAREYKSSKYSNKEQCYVQGREEKSIFFCSESCAFTVDFKNYSLTCTRFGPSLYKFVSDWGWYTSTVWFFCIIYCDKFMFTDGMNWTYCVKYF